MNAFAHHNRLVRAGLVLLLFCVLGFGLSGWSAGAISSTFKVMIDAIGCGGGASSSATYRQTDSAVGQDSPAALATSASYSENSGVVQNWPVVRNAVDEWSRY